MRNAERSPKVCHSVRAWQETRQDRGVGRIGQRCGCERLNEADSVFSQLIKGRSLNAVITITANMVGTQSINSDQKDVPTGIFAGLGFACGRREYSQKTANKECGTPHIVEPSTAAQKTISAPWKSELAIAAQRAVRLFGEMVQRIQHLWPSRRLQALGSGAFAQRVLLLVGLGIGVHQKKVRLNRGRLSLNDVALYAAKAAGRNCVRPAKLEEKSDSPLAPSLESIRSIP